MEDFDKILSFEVKREIAERYFGFRRLIEKDTENYLEKIVESSLELENKIGHDLVCIYTLLNDMSLIDKFLQLTGLPDRLFVDSDITSSPAKYCLLYNQKPRGFTRKGCFANFFLETYRRLHKHVLEYREVLKELSEERKTIQEEINLFYRKNDIATIIHFLRGMDGRESDLATTPFDTGTAANLDEKMRIHPPLPATDLLPEIPELPHEKSIRKKLKNLAYEACSRQPNLDIRQITKQQ